MESFLTHFLTHWGYLALIVVGFVQACSIPIPSEITIPFAGVLAYQHHLNLVLVIVIGTLAELAGSGTSYAIGRIGGRPAVERLGRYVLVTRSDLDRVENFLAGRGAWTVAVGRMLPLVRAFVGIVAGFVEIPVGPFALFNVIGTVIWITFLSFVGYGLGSAWSSFSHYLSIGGYVIAAVIVLALVALVAHRLREVRKERAEDAALAAAGRPARAPAPAQPGVPQPGGSYADPQYADPRYGASPPQPGAAADLGDGPGSPGSRPRPGSHRRGPSSG
ncbi:MAG: DedA family protein [Streptosporangiaceae bacterium]